MWIADKNAKPPIFHELKRERKIIATVRRIGGRKTKSGWRYQYQVVRQFVDIMGGGVGPVFKTLTAAKRYAETL